jgi:hypothetical protein
MTNGGASRSLVQGIMLKVGFPLLIGLITLLSAEAYGIPGRNSLVLALVLAFGSALFIFIVDTEIRLSAVDQRMAEGFAKIGKPDEPSSVTDRPIFDGALLTDLLHTARQSDERVNPLLERLARRDMEQVASFVRQLPAGAEITYEGEDRDWLLGLTREAKRSIDAISLSTVDAGVAGLDGGLWTSDLGIRYVELQHQAITRKVRIRRVFVFDDAEMGRDEAFQRITQAQREAGVEVRMLDHEFGPAWMQSTISDFIVFDGSVSYQTMPVTTSTKLETRPGKLRTLLSPVPARVRELEELFEQLWDAADPYRKIDE